MNKKKKKNGNAGDKVSVVMMSTFSGYSYKAPQLKYIIHSLSRRGILGDSFGLPENQDAMEYSDVELKKLKRSNLMLFLFKIVNKAAIILKAGNSYTMREKIYGIFVMLFFKADGNIILLKPRPSFLVRYYKKCGKITVVEASENHTFYTLSRLKMECDNLKIPLIHNVYTNEKAAKDYAAGINAADRIICLSEFSAHTYEREGISRDRIYVTGLVIDRKPIKPRPENTGQIVYVSVANHSILKGTIHLLRIWKKYHIPNRLMIIGLIHPDLKQYMSDYEDLENVEITGSLSHEDIEKIYIKNRCVGVLLSLSDSFPRSVRECLSTSTPMIVTETCTCDIIKNGKAGFIVDPDDENEIYQNIMRYNLMTQERYLEMAQYAYDGSLLGNNVFEDKYMGAILGAEQK